MRSLSRQDEPPQFRYEARQRFFDHYDLTALESPDFYPNGRDLGDNYTYTGWLLSPCLRSEKLDCLYCHTSSGAFRLARSRSRLPAVPSERGRQRTGPPHHQPDSAGARCRLPYAENPFRQLIRSHHSFLPPTPAATREFASPNACNLCHTDKDASWSDARCANGTARLSTPVLDSARLIDSARRRQWERAPAMLDYLRNPNHNPLTAGVIAAPAALLGRSAQSSRVPQYAARPESPGPRRVRRWSRQTRPATPRCKPPCRTPPTMNIAWSASAPLASQAQKTARTGGFLQRPPRRFLESDRPGKLLPAPRRHRSFRASFRTRHPASS